MNIKEIAKLAEVSVSTVSKIINKKDHNISSETRERVLKIVKECNYIPYSGVKTVNRTKSLLLGVLLDGKSNHEMLLRGIMETARQSGYSTIVCNSYNTEEELKNLIMLATHSVDGVLWEKLEHQNDRNEQYLSKQGIPCYLIGANGSPSHNNACLDYMLMGYCATQKLIKYKHQKIGCLVEHDGSKAECFLKGYQQCLNDNKIPLNAKLYQVLDDQSTLDDIFLHNVTGVVCYNTKIAGKAYEQAAIKNMKIPKDLSVVGLKDGQNAFYMLPQLSAVKLPLYDLGAYACNHLIASIERTSVPEGDFNSRISVDGDSSVDVPITLRNKKIVVVGTSNMDSLVNVGCFPKPGETIAAKSRSMIPGGKGLNQAIGAAKLGAEVYLITRLGKDYEGSSLYDFLNANNVNVQGVLMDPIAATGHAYIYVQGDGESSIVLYDGANQNLQPQDIESNDYMFENASFCLLQTEIKLETVEYAAKTAKKHGAKVLLKPAAITSISESLMKNVDIFLPNRNEADILCPGVSLEEKAQYFLHCGVQTVIITLDRDGCYLRNNEHSRYFEAADFKPVDTTGAADAFAATLTVYLSLNYDIITAIKYATYAAGFSITRQGVPPSLVDKSAMDLYFSEL